MLKGKTTPLLKVIVFLVLSYLCISCVKDVDFDQAEDVVLTPVVTSSVVYTQIEASRFLDSGQELETIIDSIANIEIFEEEFVIDNLVKAELIFEATNSINRMFSLQIDFLDQVDELQHTLSFDALESPSGNDIISEYTEVFEGASLEALKMTTQLAIILTLYPSEDGTSLNENSLGEISLKSKGIYYFNITL